jgi:hypothetical protein
MYPGLLAGVIGGAVGVTGGIIGTFFAIKNTKSPDERVFAIRCSIGAWLAILVFVTLVFTVPTPYKWLFLAPYLIGLPLAILWMNRTQAAIRARAPGNGPSTRTADTIVTPTISRIRWFIPRFEGEVELRSIPDDYVTRLEERVSGGFLVRGSRSRANYIVQPNSGDGVRIVAANFWSAINIGLNNVLVRRKDAQHLTYEVSFWRWTRYAVVLSGFILLVLVVCYTLAENLSWSLPSTRFARLWMWSCALFFGVCWPCVLAELHKRPAARCLERILRETLETSPIHASNALRNAGFT